MIRILMRRSMIIWVILRTGIRNSRMRGTTMRIIIKELLIIRNSARSIRIARVFMRVSELCFETVTIGGRLFTDANTVANSNILSGARTCCAICPDNNDNKPN
jgi:hypothetical protein